ncbi:uncharacterized protein LOC134531372 [Bacillus rossius redtenbacheri]|uniref:uncharacterized protein LOC134531372 n=1 Tax=Bacillus rossius redtenbacheri TaxID=93214 RepID=UPI002FDDD3AB
MPLDGQGQRRIVEYASAKFVPVERRYRVNEQECLAVSFHFTVEHVPGENEFADELSWHQDPKTIVYDDHGWDNLLSPVPITNYSDPAPDSALLYMLPGPSTPETATPFATMAELVAHVRDAQQDDPQTRARLAECGDQAFPHHLSLDGMLQTRGARRGSRWSIYAPPAARPAILLFFHSHELTGHPGAEQTLREIRRMFHWPEFTAGIKRFVRECQRCQQCKVRRPDGVEQQVPRRPDHLFHEVALDIMGPYPRTSQGKQFIIVVTDVFTRWTEAFAVANVKAGTIIALLDREVFPRSNPTERRNQDIKTQLQIRLDENHTKWEIHLPTLLYCLRRRTNEVTGYSPAELLHGHNLALPAELGVINTEEPFPIIPGQFVHVRLQHLSARGRGFCVALAPKRSGPREVVARLGTTSYLVWQPNG